MLSASRTLCTLCSVSQPVRGLRSPVVAPVSRVLARTSFRTIFAPRSIPVSGPGSSQPVDAQTATISAAIMQAMTQKIGEALETDKVLVQDMHGDGRHVSIDVVSALFDGKNAVQRQRMVYKVRCAASTKHARGLSESAEVYVPVSNGGINAPPNVR